MLGHSFRHIAWTFITARETKEITIVHILISLLTIATYLIAGFTVAVLFFAGAMFIEMIAFHVVWIYRDNRERNRPLLYAIGVETLNVVAAITGFVVLFAVSIGLQEIVGFPALYTLLLVAVGGVVALSLKALLAARSANIDGESTKTSDENGTETEVNHDED